MEEQRGFTLIEMLIVLAIAGILASIALPNYTSYIVRTRRTEGQVALVDAMQRQERYFGRHNSYVEFSAASSDTQAPDFPWWSGTRPAASAYELEGRACPGRALQDCIEIRARPGTERVDASFRDPDCGELTLDSFGNQGAQGRAAARCWP